MRIFNVLLLIAVLFFTSCEKEPQTKVDASNLILGTWVSDGYVDTLAILKRADAFAEDLSGIQFNADGTLVKRMNSGWCGTPPVSYENNKGSWTQRNDSIIEICCEFWGGVDEYEMKVVALNEKQLHYTYVFDDF